MLGATLIALVLGLGAAAASTAAADIYTPPSPLPAGRPGDVIAAQPTTAFALPGIALPASLWLILYRSTDVLGRPIAVSGTVLVPRTPWTGPGPRPIVGFAVGTQGLADRCAASKQLASGTEYESPNLAAMLGRGWAVAVTDYPGLGTPGTHPYVVGRTLGRSVLDSMRAATRLPATGLDPHAPALIYGYSEGGEAAGWALQLQPTYAPEIPLRGGAVGAAPANFFGELDFLSQGIGNNFAFLMIYAAVGFDAAYPELHLDSYLNAAGRDAVAANENSCIEDAIARGLLAPRQISHYVTSDPLTQPDWRARLAENNLGTIAPRVPVILGRARQDEAIAPQLTLDLYHEWCALGVDARFDDMPLGDHLSGGFEFAPTGEQFLADRLAGVPLPRAPDCPAG